LQSIYLITGYCRSDYLVFELSVIPLLGLNRDNSLVLYPNTAFHVVIYLDEGDYVEGMIPHFERLGLQYLNYDEMMKLSVEDGLAIAGDGHPTGTAHKLVAEWIVTDLGLAATTDN